jgi:hypothetical protein
MVPILEKFQAIETNLQKLVSEDKIKLAISILLDFCIKYSKDNNSTNEVLIQSASLHRVMEAFNNNTIDWELMSQHKNKVIFALMCATNKIKQEIMFQADNDSIPPELRHWNGGGGGGSYVPKTLEGGPFNFDIFRELANLISFLGTDDFEHYLRRHYY